MRPSPQLNEESFGLKLSSPPMGTTPPPGGRPRPGCTVARKMYDSGGFGPYAVFQGVSADE